MHDLCFMESNNEFIFSGVVFFDIYVLLVKIVTLYALGAVMSGEL